MQTIRGIILIVTSFLISVCSLAQEPKNINHHLLSVNEITFDSYTLNSFLQSNSSTGIASVRNNSNTDNTSNKVKTIQPILIITESYADDLLVKPYVL